ncbi:MAG: hypothetical protein IJE77_11845, partial [Thermoguttaceae bacterium]|nr:hypothetical protein [Thermoguttaceae bacterium]
MSVPFDSDRSAPDAASTRPASFLAAATYGLAPNETPLPSAAPSPRLADAATARFADVYRRLVAEIEKAFVGQRELV